MKIHRDNRSNFALAKRLVALSLLVSGLSMTGCTALLTPIETIPANRVPREFLAELQADKVPIDCLLYTSPSPRDATLSRMPSSA